MHFIEPLPSSPPAGKKRYKAICQDPQNNPFRGRGISRRVQTVDVDADTPLAQVEAWAREAAGKSGLVFVELETVTE